MSSYDFEEARRQHEMFADVHNSIYETDKRLDSEVQQLYVAVDSARRDADDDVRHLRQDLIEALKRIEKLEELVEKLMK